MNRRSFVQAAPALLALNRAPAQTPVPSPPYDREKLRRVGVIGPGWYGKCDLFRLIQVANVEVVSLCDVDQRMLEQAAELTAQRQRSKKKPRIYRDYRQMLRDGGLDIVLIATPDHWHALPAIEALRAGCHLYLQKPISVDVVEGQAILAAARKYNRVVQVGTQRRSTPHLIEARDEIIRAGRLGRIGHVEICCYYAMRSRENPPDTQPPAWLDYEMWVGPAPMRPYNPMLHPGRWRQFMEYSNGIVGDMCIHMYDMVRWMLGLGWPKSVSSSAGIYVTKGGKGNISDTQTAIFRHDDLDVVWTHRTWGPPPDPNYTWAAFFYGEKGVLKASVYSYDFIPLKGQGDPVHRDVTYELEQFPEDKTEERLERHVAPAIRYHMMDLLSAIDHNRRPVADIEQGHISTAACILANISAQLNRTLHWDAAAGSIRGDEEANRLLARPYRAPWVHPDPKTV
ncbi:MAG: oxidoreductase [Bryobacteraceae bacterium]|nr:MAG: oxidoreductase [Bryobacteraceae bacterium]